MAAMTASTIMIAAPRATVMTVIADFAGYPGWAGARSAEVVGEPDAGGRARMVRFELDAGMIRDRFVLGYRWDGDERVRWELPEHGSVISAMSGAYMLADRGGGTEVCFELTAGLRIPVSGMVRRRAERQSSTPR
jgi:hypothetical protein